MASVAAAGLPCTEQQRRKGEIKKKNYVEEIKKIKLHGVQRCMDCLVF